MINLDLLPLDLIFVKLEEFRADKNPRKINLGIGIYSDFQGNPYVMPSVVKAAQNLDCSNFNYAGMKGDKEFLDLVVQFILPSFKNEQNYEIAQIQTAGGTHAVKLYGNLSQKQGIENYILPTPTWGNYKALLSHRDLLCFPHLLLSGEVNFAEYLSVIKDLSDPQKTVLVLQGGQPHNQTGKNLSLDQLKSIIPLINEKKLSVLIDAAYLGLGDEMDQDLVFVETAFSQINKVTLAVSFSKNACLYRHRCGALFIKAENAKYREILESHLQVDTRTTISNPPAFGAMVMKDVLLNDSQNWQKELLAMKKSIDQRREFLVNSLSGKVDYFRDCRGMFGVLQLSQSKIQKLQTDYGIYVLPSGRVNFAGITDKNKNYLAQSLLEIL